MAFTASDPIKIILAILLPPLGVFFEVGLTKHFWLNILLTLFGFIPGIIHALYVIFKH
ncbi:MAG: YqaE/Pmp3 family membrane protein [Pseudomonadota bacterium]